MRSLAILALPLVVLGVVACSSSESPSVTTSDATADAPSQDGNNLPDADGGVDAYVDDSLPPDADADGDAYAYDALPAAPDAGECTPSTAPEVGPCCERFRCFMPGADAGAWSGDPTTGCPSADAVPASPGYGLCGSSSGPYRGPAEAPCCYLVPERTML